jgi:hypothetical protein
MWRRGVRFHYVVSLSLSLITCPNTQINPVKRSFRAPSRYKRLLPTGPVAHWLCSLAILWNTDTVQRSAFTSRGPETRWCPRSPDVIPQVTLYSYRRLGRARPRVIRQCCARPPRKDSCNLHSRREHVRGWRRGCWRSHRLSSWKRNQEVFI